MSRASNKKEACLEAGFSSPYEWPKRLICEGKWFAVK